MTEFSRVYGVHTHVNHRTDISPRPIPHLGAVGELLQKSRRIEESLKRIREMVIAQHYAMEQQRKKPEPSGSENYTDMNGYADEKQGMGGFANGDTKKRRGVSP
jgi:hypothetical protein